MTTFSRRKLLSSGACVFTGAALGVPVSVAASPPFPTKPILIKVAFPAGGPADVAIRAATVLLQRNLGQPLIADNQPGASGSIAANFVGNSAADGYTLLCTTGIDFLVAPFTIASAKYQPSSFKLLGVVGISDFILVSSPAFDFKDTDDLIAYAKKNPSKPLSIAHWGAGSGPHLVAADFAARAGIQLLEVPYKGAAPAVANIAGNQVDLTFVPLGGSTLGMIQSGKMKPIGLASNTRNPALPNLPTINESRSLKDFDYALWAAVLAPSGTPDAIVARLTSALNEWVVSPENLARITANASRRLDPMSPEQAAVFLKSEHDKFNRVARSLKLDPQ